MLPALRASHGCPPLRDRIMEAVRKRGQVLLPFPSVTWDRIARATLATATTGAMGLDRPGLARAVPPVSRPGTVRAVPRTAPDLLHHPVLQLPLPFESLGRALRVVQPTASPCTPCAKRATCKAPCELLAGLLSPEDVSENREISSPALMAGMGRDPQFMSTDTHEWDTDETVEIWPRVVAFYGPRLRAAVARLTGAQRVIIDSVLDGESSRQIALRRHVSRQAAWKVLQSALRTLGRELGPLPSRARLERLPDPDADAGR